MLLNRLAEGGTWPQTVLMLVNQRGLRYDKLFRDLVNQTGYYSLAKLQAQALCALWWGLVFS